MTDKTVFSADLKPLAAKYFEEFGKNKVAITFVNGHYDRKIYLVIESGGGDFYLEELMDPKKKYRLEIHVEEEE